MTTRFQQKLSTLNHTLSLFDDEDHKDLIIELSETAQSLSIAVGSGGSLVSAQYFRKCVKELSGKDVPVQTPTQIVFDPSFLLKTNVWLFSASADNSDIAAAARAAIERGAQRLILVTRNTQGMVADFVRTSGGAVIGVPVAEQRDGYLATHSLLATCTALLRASNGIVQTSGEGEINKLQAHLAGKLTKTSLSREVQKCTPFAQDPILLLIADPLLEPVTILLETSLWEAAICPVQTTDARNFAHGRHTWPHHHAEKTLVLALTSETTEYVWKKIRASLPEAIPVIEQNYQNSDRLEVLYGIIDGLFLIDAIGAVKGIDPGKPGVGDFGRDMYSDDALLEASKALSSPIRQKAWASLHTRDRTTNTAVLSNDFQDKLRRLTSRDIGGIVMDFDGTVVETEHRLEPPRHDVVNELIRLHDLGIGIGFASGRGGSLGDQLREVFPVSYLDSILVGYFNGGFIVPASEDIHKKRPPKNQDIDRVAHWLETHSDLLQRPKVPRKEIQLTIPYTDIKNPKNFLEDTQHCDLILQGAVRVVASGHSYDIIPSASSKLKVIERFQDIIGPDKAVISIGDCGHSEGNDHQFLARDFGISVDQICGDAHGTWSIFGAKLTGPSALQKILCSMIPSANGGIRIDGSRLILDTDV